MEYYGNILTLYNSDEATTAQIKQMIQDSGFPFELIERTFFFGTSSIKKSKDFQKEIALLPVHFTFFFLFNSDGSTFKSNGVDTSTLDHINTIFF